MSWCPLCFFSSVFLVTKQKKGKEKAKNTHTHTYISIYVSSIFRVTKQKLNRKNKKKEKMGDLGIGQGRCPQCENGKCGSIEENRHWKESVSGDRRGRSELGHGYSDPRDAPRRIWRLRRQRLRTANTPSRTHPPIPFQCWEIERESLTHKHCDR